jgi:phosphoglycolate phosphatase-like HAD superfamily hydrolase
MALDAMLFDLDGTLVDTNELHVRAWVAAFASLGYRVAADRVWVEIGKGGDQLVPDLLGREVDRKDGDALRAAYVREFKKLAEAEGVRPFTGARELL